MSDDQPAAEKGVSVSRPVPSLAKIAFTPEMVQGMKGRAEAVEQRIAQDARSMLGGAPGYLRFHIQTSGRTPVHLRADRIHGYAPLGDGMMELFSSQHVWKVHEHYLALERILRLDDEYLLGLADGIAAALQREHLRASIAALATFLPAAAARK